MDNKKDSRILTNDGGQSEEEIACELGYCSNSAKGKSFTELAVSLNFYPF